MNKGYSHPPCYSLFGTEFCDWDWREVRVSQTLATFHWVTQQGNTRLGAVVGAGRTGYVYSEDLPPDLSVSSRGTVGMLGGFVEPGVSTTSAWGLRFEAIYLHTWLEELPEGTPNPSGILLTRAVRYAWGLKEDT